MDKEKKQTFWLGIDIAFISYKVLLLDPHYMDSELTKESAVYALDVRKKLRNDLLSTHKKMILDIQKQRTDEKVRVANIMQVRIQNLNSFIRRINDKLNRLIYYKNEKTNIERAKEQIDQIFKEFGGL